MGVESEHRVLGRIVSNTNPANNLSILAPGPELEPFSLQTALLNASKVSIRATGAHPLPPCTPKTTIGTNYAGNINQKGSPHSQTRTAFFSSTAPSEPTHPRQPKPHSPESLLNYPSRYSEPAGLPKRLSTTAHTHHRHLIATHVRGVAQSGSAPGSGPGGRRFESSRPDHLTQKSRSLQALHPSRSLQAIDYSYTQTSSFRPASVKARTIFPTS
jgi:hypothetical protein